MNKKTLDDFIKDSMSVPLIISNDDHRIAETNYWQTEISRRSYYYMSLNAGYYRLLVPENNDGFLKEISTASTVTISRGATSQLDPPRSDAFEIVFEDGTDSPYALLMTPEYWDRFPADNEQGWNGKMAIYWKSYKKPVKEFEKVYYRHVNTLPCFDPIEN